MIRTHDRLLLILAILESTDLNPTIGETSYYEVRGEQEPDLIGASAGETWTS